MLQPAGSALDQARGVRAVDETGAAGRRGRSTSSSAALLPTETDSMIGPSSFGHTSRGTSLAFADPEHGMAFAYAINRVVGGGDDVRAASLFGTVRGALA
ncbi:beta-lactamase family protein [Streptomyces albus subsp. chlorinus]|nr:beta-lactamase family protein [Streptomyces albus subsp. chlorinus]